MRRLIKQLLKTNRALAKLNFLMPDFLIVEMPAICSITLQECAHKFNIGDSAVVRRWQITRLTSLPNGITFSTDCAICRWIGINLRYLLQQKRF